MKTHIYFHRKDPCGNATFPTKAKENRLIYNRVILMILLAFIGFSTGFAQIYTGTITVDPPNEGFQIDGNMYADDPVSPGGGDWVQCVSGTCTGGNVLHNNGNPLDTATTFHLTDLYNTTGDNIFTKGKVNTDPSDPTSYTWGYSKAVGKTDMNNALIHFTTDTVTGHVWIIFSADRLVNTGSSYMDFEFLQNTLDIIPGGTFSSDGPDGGRTEDDFILSIAFGNSGAAFELLTWGYDSVAGAWDYLAPTDPLPDSSVFAQYNSTSITSPYSVFGGTTYIPVSFIEAGVDLTALLGTINPCNDLVIKTIFVKTKVSAGGNSGVEDFFDPLQVNNLSLGNANAGPDVTICPGSSYQLDGEATPSPGYVVSTTTWSIVSGAGTISDATILDPTITVTTSPATFNLNVVTTNGSSSCSVDDQVVITVEDIDPPSISCIADQARNTETGLCTYSVVGTELDPATTYDSCGVSFVSNDINQGSTLAGEVFAAGTHTITWTVTDVGANTATCSFNLTVTDDEAPSITCPANITQTADPGVCGAAVTVPAPTTDDNCAVDFVTNDFNGTADASDTYPVGTTTVIFTVTDIHGNTNTCSMDVTVTDNEAPSIICPANITQTADAGQCNAVVSVPAPTTDDNCAVQSVSNDYTQVPDASGTYPVGTTTVVFTVTDIHGNINTCSMDVTVTDDEAPSIICPANITQTADAGQCNAVVPVPAPTTSDNCGVQSVSNDHTQVPDALGTYPVGTTTVTFTVTDIHGNTNTCSMDVTVTDDEAPSITCPDNITQTADAGQCNAAVIVPAPTTGDNCAVDYVTNDFNGTADASDTYPVGTTTVVFTVTDIHGNTNTCSMTVTVTDDEAPSISCPAAITQTADPGVCQAAVTVFAPVTADNCAVDFVTNDFNGTADASDTYPVGTTTVVFTVTDIHGNTNTCSMDVTVTDDEDPSITCPAEITQTADAGQCDALVSVPAPTTGDNCGVLSVSNDYTQVPDASGTYPVGTTTVVFTVTDIHGNTNTCSMDVTVTDDEAPSITCPANITQTADPGVCNAAVTVPAPSTGDNCGILSYVNDYNGLADASDTYPVGTTTVTFTVTDIHGNTNSCTMEVTVTDDEAPSISCPAAITQTADPGVCQAAVTVSAPVTADNCAVDFVTNDKNGTADASDTYLVGTTTVVFTVTDIHGNTNTCSMDVTVTDDEDPSITCPADITQTADAGQCNALVSVPAPTTSDNCGVQSVSNDYTQVPDASGTYPVGTTTVVFTVTDIHGNNSTCSMNVTVTDDEAPTITCPSDITQTADPGVCEAAVSVNAPSTGDNCGVDFYINDYNGTADASDTYPVGTTTVVFTVTDIHGNTNSCTMDVTVTDDEDPVISTCPSDRTVYLDIYCQFEVPNLVPEAVVSDNCNPLPRVTQSPTPGTLIFSQEGTQTTVTITADDLNGNTSTCSVILTADDTIPPVIVTTLDNRILPLNGSCEITVPDYTTGVDVTDGCDDNVDITQNPLEGSLLSSGEGVDHMILVTADDGNGNTTTDTVYITGDDVTDPTITTCPVNRTLQLDELCQLTVPDLVSEASATDNCSVPVITQSPLAGTELASGEGTKHTITIIADDNNGNTSTCLVVLTGDDVIDPVITTCPADREVSLTGACELIVPDITPDAIATDNCGDGSITFSQSPLAGTTLSSGHGVTHQITVTANDGRGNTSDCFVTLTGKDDIAPSVTICPATRELEGCSENVITEPAYNSGLTASSYAVFSGSPNNGDASDNCVINEVYYQDALAGSCPIVVTRTWTLMDQAGNSTFCEQTINVMDLTAPNWLTAAGDLDRTLDCSDAAGIIAAQQLFPVASDNCDPDVTNIVKVSGDFLPDPACPQSGSYTNTWTVTDECGNTSVEYTQVLYVDDNTAPTFTGPADIIVQKDANCLADIDPSITGLPSNIADNCDPSPTVSYNDESCFSTDINGQMNHGVGYYYPVEIHGYDDYTASQLEKVFMSFSTQKGKGNVEFTLIAPSGDGVMLIGPYCDGGYCDDLNQMTNYSPSFYPENTGYTQWENDNYIAPGPGSFTPYSGVSSVNSINDIDYLTNYVSSFEELSGPMNGTWYIYGRKWGTATGTMSFDGVCITPIDCEYNDLIVRTWTATDACGNSGSAYRQSIIVRDLTAPTWTTAPGALDVLVGVGDPAALAAAQAMEPDAADNCDTLPVLIKTEGDFVPCPDCPHAGTYTNTWTVSDACGNTQTEVYTQVITVSDQFDLTGKVTYYNKYYAPMDGVEVILYRDDEVIGSTNTNNDGIYQFSSLLEGTYRVEMTTAKPSGGINSSDAGLTNYWWTNPWPIEHVHWDAGNFVSADNFINSTDAGAILSYFVRGVPLPTPDFWTFYMDQNISSANPPAPSLDIVVCGQQKLQDFFSLCVGDFNRSFIPATNHLKSDELATVELENRGAIKAGNGHIIELPVQVTEDVEIGALSLVLDIPTHFVTVEDVAFTNGKDYSYPGEFEWDMIGSQLRIGWYSLKPIYIREFSELVTLKLKTKNDFTKGNICNISLVDDPLNELADAGYETIFDAVLQIPGIEGNTPGTGSEQSEPGIYVQPNPFIDHALLNYSVPERGKIVVELVNMLGMKVETIIEGTHEKGQYNLNIEGEKLTPGVYTIVLYYYSNGDLTKKTTKIVRGISY